LLTLKASPKPIDDILDKESLAFLFSLKCFANS
jgi:hypothetical protein